MRDKKFARALRSKIGFKESWAEFAARQLAAWFGSLWFLIVHMIFYLGWIMLNAEMFSLRTPYDPFPFNVLMIVVPFISIFLSNIILISQNQQTRMTEIRQRIDFEINVRAEHEITKILEMLEVIHAKLGLDTDDHELSRMKERIDITQIKSEIERTIEEEEQNDRS